MIRFAIVVAMLRRPAPARRIAVAVGVLTVALGILAMHGLPEVPGPTTQHIAEIRPPAAAAMTEAESVVEHVMPRQLHSLHSAAGCIWVLVTTIVLLLALLRTGTNSRAFVISAGFGIAMVAGQRSPPSSWRARSSCVLRR